MFQKCFIVCRLINLILNRAATFFSALLKLSNWCCLLPFLSINQLTVYSMVIKLEKHLNISRFPKYLLVCFIPFSIILKPTKLKLTNTKKKYWLNILCKCRSVCTSVVEWVLIKSLSLAINFIERACNVLLCSQIFYNHIVRQTDGQTDRHIYIHTFILFMK